MTTKNFKKTSQLLDTLTSAAIRLSTGFYKSTPKVFLYQDGGFQPLLKLAIKANHLFLHRRISSRPNHPTRVILMQEILENPKSHPSPLHNLIEKEFFRSLHSSPSEIILHDPILSWIDPAAKIFNLDLSRTEAIKTIPQQIQYEHTKAAIICFTDGSCIPGKGTSGAMLISDKKFSSTLFLGEATRFSNYEAELIGLNLALGKTRSMISSQTDISSLPFKAVAIFCDNQAALTFSNYPVKASPGQHIAIKNFTLIHELSKNISV